MIAAIFAQSPEGVIGIDGLIPWKHPGDLRRFKRVTLESTIIMGRKTWESIGSRPLPKRQNIVLSRTATASAGVALAHNIFDAMSMATYPDVWFIGGAEVYAAAMPYVDLVDVTYVPDRIDIVGGAHTYATMAPEIDPEMFAEGPLWAHDDDPTLLRRTYVRRTLSEEPYELADNRRLQEKGTLRRTAS